MDIKDDPNIWISALDLYQGDRAILQSTDWLNDGMIFAAQSLLREQTKEKVYGWQSTQCGKKEGLFDIVPQKCPFVQILHVANCHWVVASNINVHDGGCYSDVVCSGRPTNIGLNLRKAIRSFLKCASDILRFDVMNVVAQPNSYDCGVYALACATELAFGFDPVLCRWKCEDSAMRNHLIHCFEAGKLTRFPTVGKRRIPFGTRVRKSVTEELVCVCRTINDK